jgi:hypothetical protein
MMKLKCTIAFIASFLVISTVSAFELVSSEEVHKSEEAAMLEMELTVPDALAPQIQVLEPDVLDKPLKNPFKMEVFFKPQNGALLDFSTFKAYYGTFKLDITDRLMKQAVKTASSIRLSNVDIPSGRHKIFISIKDNLGHTAAKEIAFKVE